MKYIGTAEKEFDKWMEDGEPAPESVGNACGAMYDAFETYLNGIEEHWWKQGYNWAVQQILGGGAK